MMYKDEEILARVHYTGQKLVYLNEDGSLNLESETIFEMEHEDETVVWFEIADMESINTPFQNNNGFYDTIEDAKKAIDWYEEEHKDDE